MMKELKLKNGGVELDVCIAAMTMAMESLLAETPIAFFDLVMKARDDTHELFGNSQDILRKAALLEPGGTMRQDTRNIVLSSVEGDEGEMHMVDPIDREVTGR